jgi:hypothetical protein
MKRYLSLFAACILLSVFLSACYIRERDTANMWKYYPPGADTSFQKLTHISDFKYGWRLCFGETVLENESGAYIPRLLCSIFQPAARGRAYIATRQLPPSSPQRSSKTTSPLLERASTTLLFPA